MSILHRITLDKQHSKMMGVCSGLAGALGYSRLTVRILALFALFFAPVVSITAYFTAALLLPARRFVHHN